VEALPERELADGSGIGSAGANARNAGEVVANHFQIHMRI
jgi:hypothetical protein